MHTMTVFSGTAGGIPRFMGTSYCTKHHETAGSLALKSDVKPFIKTSLCQNFKMYVRLVLLFLCFIEPNFTASLQRDEVICINNYKCLRKNQIENPNKLDKVGDSLKKSINIWDYFSYSDLQKFRVTLLLLLRGYQELR